MTTAKTDALLNELRDLLAFCLSVGVPGQIRTDIERRIERRIARLERMIKVETTYGTDPR